MSENTLNPMGHIYDSFVEILNNMTIKYGYLAEEGESTSSKMRADGFLDAVLKRDSFETYVDYKWNEYIEAGISDEGIINEAMKGRTSVVPSQYRTKLLEIRRKRVIKEYEEFNNYYRCLNGLPDATIKQKSTGEEYLEYNKTDFFYITDAMAETYGIDKTIPIHLIQDTYNAIEDGLGDRYIALIEGSGYIKKLVEAHPEYPYLKYFGTSRIPLHVSRPAKNFQIIQLKHGNLKNLLYNQFTQIYEQCREYFMTVIYIRSFRTVIDNYDKFIAMAIFVMAIQQLVMKQMQLTVNREFFDIYAVRMLYQAYGIPYNLNLDEESQSRISQNLNLFFQNKATNKGIYDIAAALGFGDNFAIYKYYLSKQHKYDTYGVPLFRKTTRFNNDTGEIDIVPDYEYMYDIYFHRAALEDDKFINTFNDAINTETYNDVTLDDPFWWRDSNTYKKIWETEYNFVESKYLGLTISYKITDMFFENVLLLKLLLTKEDEIKDLRITLPKITGEVEIPVFDIAILLICLTACKHNLTGEIITLPTQVIQVLDYIQNTEYSTEFTVDTFSFNFDYFDENNADSQENLRKIYKYLTEEEAEKLKGYLSILHINSLATKEEKINALNQMFDNIKLLYRFINLKMSETDNRLLYEELRTLYRAAFFSREMKDMFTITGSETGFTRTALNYFEYLRFKNPLLYNAVFDLDYTESFEDFKTLLTQVKEGSAKVKSYASDGSPTCYEYNTVSIYHNHIDEYDIDTVTYDDFITKVETGEIYLHYDIIKNARVDNIDIKNERIYFFINHAISRLEIIVKKLQYIYLLSDAVTPLEDLLLKMIKFFKSYTTELIDLDDIFIFNLKPSNIFRLFDEVNYICKWILTKEHIHLPYSDIAKIVIEYLLCGGDVKLWERKWYQSNILIDRVSSVYNSVHMKDYWYPIFKEILKKEKWRLYDIPLMSNTIEANDTHGILHDKTSRMWYTEETEEPTEEELSGE